MTFLDVARRTGRHLLAGTPATSVFVYGSVARGDATPSSDVELGVIAEPGRLSRAALAGLVGPGVRAYPFTASGLQDARPDVPFPARMFAAEVATVAVTVAGDEVVERLACPVVTVHDLQALVSFQLGVLVGVLEPLRDGHERAAVQASVKAGFAAARALTALTTARLAFGYDPTVYTVPYPLRELLVRLVSVRHGGGWNHDMLFAVMALLHRDCTTSVMDAAARVGWQASVVPSSAPRVPPG